MRLENKQVDDLESFFNKIIINARIYNGIVTLERADGTSFSFVAVGNSYDKGETGDKGDTGNRGDSAWQAYKRNGGTLSEEAWLDALIGEQGDKGSDGTDGIDGINGTDGLSPVITDGIISQDENFETPAAELLKRDNNTYTIKFTVPTGSVGEQGDSVVDQTVRTGNVQTVNDKISEGRITGNADNAVLNFMLRRGEQGFPGNNAVPAVDGIVPDIKISVNMISEDRIPTVTKDINGDIWHLTLNIPKGKKGIAGLQGKKGKRATLVPDINYSDICEEEGIINAPSLNSFRAVAFKIGDIRYHGWSVNSNGKIFQGAFAPDGTFVARKKNNGVFGSVTEGWIQSSDITGWGG